MHRIALPTYSKVATARCHYGTRAPLDVLTQHFSPAVPRAPKGNDIVVDYAKGCWITDISGRKYLDFQSGIGVTSTGHCHPRVVEAIQQQAALGIHLQQNCTISRPTIALLERLAVVAPAGLSRFFFNVTGTEANESAIKLARHETGRQNIIYFKGSFHGRSLATLAMTSSKTAYRVGYGPLPSGMHQATFPYCIHCPSGASATATGCCGAARDSVLELLKETSAPSDTAAIIIEPILGEGGYVVPPIGFLQQLRKICDDHGILLIADEVQSGVGRTGKWWAVQHEGVTPDILVFAKGIASGMPISGIMTRPDMMSKSPPGSMGSTFGANAVSAAAASATIDVIREQGLLLNAEARGAQLFEGLLQLKARFPDHILDVRGRGCMVGLEFSHAPGSGFAGAVTSAAMAEGLLLLTTGWRETIRFIPPLIVSEAEMHAALGMFERALEVAVRTVRSRA